VELEPTTPGSKVRDPSAESATQALPARVEDCVSINEASADDLPEKHKIIGRRSALAGGPDCQSGSRSDDSRQVTPQPRGWLRQLSVSTLRIRMTFWHPTGIVGGGHRVPRHGPFSFAGRADVAGSGYDRDLRPPKVRPPGRGTPARRGTSLASRGPRYRAGSSAGGRARRPPAGDRGGRRPRAARAGARAAT